MPMLRPHSPKQMATQDGHPVYLYSVDPFDSIEVSVSDDTVSSIIIHLQQPVPAKPLAEQLQLATARALQDIIVELDAEQREDFAYLLNSKGLVL